MINQLNQIAGVTGCLVTSHNGQLQAHSVQHQLSTEELARLAVTLFDNLAVQIKRLQRGSLKRMVIESEMGLTVLSQAPGGMLVLVFISVTEGFNLNKLLSTLTALTGV